MRRRQIVILLVLAAGCGFNGLGTREAPGDGGVRDGGTPPDGAPVVDASGTDGSPVVDAEADAPVDGAPVPCSSGGAYCGPNGQCFTDCGQDNHCPGLDNNCVTCVAGPRREICGAACGSSFCGCAKTSDCPNADEFCPTGACVACNALSIGQRCKNGKSCLKCDDNTFHCADAPDQC